MGRYEQPRYTIVSRCDGYEIRKYDAHLVAETIVEQDFDSAGSIAFRRLAGYIFGRNSESLRMNMTVPVTQQANADGSHQFRFMMENSYSEDELPRPVDGSVCVTRVPEGHFAALSYRGGRSRKMYAQREGQFQDLLARDDVSPAGSSVLAVYSGPTTPPILRRNEILVPVIWPPAHAAQ